MQNDEVTLQRKVRTEVFQLEDTLAQVRKEYEMLRIEFEQTLAANEQAGKGLIWLMQRSTVKLDRQQFHDSKPFLSHFFRSHKQRNASPD